MNPMQSLVHELFRRMPEVLLTTKVSADPDEGWPEVHWSFFAHRDGGDVEVEIAHRYGHAFVVSAGGVGWAWTLAEDELDAGAVADLVGRLLGPAGPTPRR